MQRTTSQEYWAVYLKDAAETPWDDYTQTIQLDRFTPQHWFRMVNLLLNFASCLGAEAYPTQLAVGIADSFLSRVRLKVTSVLDLVCVLSLSLALKFDCKRMVNIATLIELTHDRYSATNIRAFEMLMVCKLDTQVNLPTAFECLPHITDRPAEQELVHWAHRCYSSFSLTRKGPFAVAVCAVLCKFFAEAREDEGKSWLSTVTAQAKVGSHEIEAWARDISSNSSNINDS